MSHQGAVIALVVALAAPVPHAATRDEVLVSAASSLTDVLEPLAAAYETQTGDHVILNLGASNTLARQIASGARVDVFISADEAQMDRVAGLILAGTRVDLLSNQLAIAVPDDRPRTLRSARELTDPAVRRIAIGDPAAVPAGVYARSYFQRLGIWSSLERKIVPAGSVRLALAAVESGAVDAAVVYRTDIRTAKRVREAFVVPRGEGPRIVYPAAVLTSGRNPRRARRLLAFLQGPDATATFARAGFIPLRGDGVGR